MSSYDRVYIAIEDFLAKERDKLSEDRSVLNLVFQSIENKQQNCEHVNQNRKADKNIQVDFLTAQHSENSHAVIGLTCGDETKLRKHRPSFAKSSRTLSYYDSQVEKERLACVFENGPYFLSFNHKTRRKGNESTTSYMRQEKCDNTDRFGENKENDAPEDDCLRIPRSQSSAPEVKENNYRENVRTMVRYGEFSPLNPALIPSSRPLLGLGEYEERRKTFLEKKKLEYQQYLASAKNSRNRISNRRKKNLCVHRTIDDKEDARPSSPESPVSQRSSQSYRELFTPDRGLIDGLDTCVNKHRQEMYRKELDKQVEEKKKLKKIKENQEKLNCQKCEDSIVAQRKNTMKHIEDEFHRRIDLMKAKENQNENADSFKNSASQDQANTSNLSTTGNIHQSSGERPQSSKCIDGLPSFIRYPTVTTNAESCAIDDVGALQRLQQELYKRELAQQIEEKHRLEEDRKAKLKEEEKKLEEKVKKEEEKLKQDYDREQAELAYRAAQRVQIQERVLENLRRVQNETDATKVKSMPKQLSKSSNVLHTDHKFPDKSNTKAVSFAPQASVYSIHDAVSHPVRSPVITRNASHCKADSIIIEAPYLMAVKDTPACCNTTKQPTDCTRVDECTRSPSPILPAVRTRNLLKSLSKSDEPYIPSAVSMSKCAKEKFLRSNRIFSNFAQIRRQLMERQSYFHSD